MAQRPVFLIKETKPYFEEIYIDFKYYSGFSKLQKQKTIMSLHNAFYEKYSNFNILEISSKSNDELGIKLSAFNLLIETKKTKKKYSVESVFQSSKVFEGGGPYYDILDKTPREAKRDERLKNSGNLKFFYCFKKKFELEPKHYFYNWLYVNALSQKINEELVEDIIEYNAFTDIEFNPLKSINCQARAAAIYVSLRKKRLLSQALESKESFLEVVYGMKYKEELYEQTSIFEDK